MCVFLLLSHPPLCRVQCWCHFRCCSSAPHQRGFIKSWNQVDGVSFSASSVVNLTGLLMFSVWSIWLIMFLPSYTNPSFFPSFHLIREKPGPLPCLPACPPSTTGFSTKPLRISSLTQPPQLTSAQWVANFLLDPSSPPLSYSKPLKSFTFLWM